LNIPVYKIMLVKEISQDSEGKQINNNNLAAEVLQEYLKGADRENFVVLLLNTKNKVVGINTVSIGSLDSSLVHPREVFKPAVLASAAGIILGHNHPSGDPEPSKEDLEITIRLLEAGQILGIYVRDHIIIGDNCHVSLRGRGYFTKNGSKEACCQ
jgi:DNA repair protein RadC